MKTRLCLHVLLLGLFSALLLAAESAVPFRPVSFATATEAAKAEGKLVFVDFYTTWCGPCKMLDAQTWTDAKVGQLLGEKTVPLKFDAEKEGREAAKHYQVTAYPTLLLVQPDGTEVDRLVGFRPPAEFLADFGKLLLLAQSGKSGLEQARETVAQQTKSDVTAGDPEEAQPHLDLAKKLIVAGNQEEALKELLWCWDEGKKDPDFSRMARSTQVPRELGRLAQNYPPARDAMVVRRDQTRERALANKGGSVVIQDLIALNRELKMNEDTLAVFDQIPEGDRRRVTISIYLFDLFVEKQRYVDALLFNMPEMFISRIESAKAELKRNSPASQALLHSTVTSIANRIEALAGTGRLDDARDLGKRLLALDDSTTTKELLRARATRAGQPELFKDE